MSTVQYHFIFIFYLFMSHARLIDVLIHSHFIIKAQNVIKWKNFIMCTFNAPQIFIFGK